MKHPNIFILINFIKKLNSTAIVDVERLKQGFEITKRSKETIDKDARIEAIKKRFNSGKCNFEDYFIAISQQIQYTYTEAEIEDSTSDSESETEFQAEIMLESFDVDPIVLGLSELHYQREVESQVENLLGIQEVESQVENLLGVQVVESQVVQPRFHTSQVIEALMNDTEGSKSSYLSSITDTAPLNEIANRNAEEQEIYEAA